MAPLRVLYNGLVVSNYLIAGGPRSLYFNSITAIVRYFFQKAEECVCHTADPLFRKQNNTSIYLTQLYMLASQFYTKAFISKS